jgi:UDP-2,4-diacetamido-2,4,6-trideoxy-beta-L-altropyranose hydrolase
MRCLVLARELRKNNYNVTFAIRSQEGDSIKFIRSHNFFVHVLPLSNQALIPKTNADYSAWLQVPWKLDAQQFIDIVKRADLVITDHYALASDWQKEVKEKLACKVLAIDDLVRHHDADLILDQTLMRAQEEYSSSNTSILAGCDFALLNPQFSKKREFALEKSTLPHDRKILVSMGGVDQDNITLTVLHALEQGLAIRPKITVLLSPKAPHYDAVKYFCSQQREWIEHIDFVDDMANIMLEHDLSIGAPGTTSWERACLGLPSIIIPLAENQRTISINLVNASAAILVEANDIKVDLVSAYYKLIKEWAEIRQNSLNICDGLGVYRVADSINDLLLGKRNKLAIRRALLEDSQQVYDWQCEPETRKYALTKKIPSRAEHQSWMNKKISAVGDYFYIITSSEEGKSVGVIRLDRCKMGEYVVSIFMSPEHYGKGIAKWALNYLDNIHQNVTIHATVLEANMASQKLFTSANYQRVSCDTFIRSPII